MHVVAFVPVATVMDPHTRERTALAWSSVEIAALPGQMIAGFAAGVDIKQVNWLTKRLYN
jgi:hypothetical protein